MCDNFDDFNDFGENDFMEDDSFEYNLEGEMDGTFVGDNKPEDESDVTESQDDEFSGKDAFIIGGAMGYAYHEGRRERKRRKRRRFRDDDD